MGYFKKDDNYLIQLCIFILLSFVSSNTYAGTIRYVDPNSPNPGSGYRTWATAAHTIKDGISAMQGGDDLIIRDGVYRGEENCLYYYGEIPSGSEDDYTEIRAEHDFGVLIDGEGVRAPWWIGISSHETSYVEFRGLKFANSNQTNVFLYHCSHIKFLKCASFEAGEHNSMNFSSDTNSCDYILLEDCFAWGRGRYKFEVSAPHTVLRRCVARPDYHSAPDGSWNWPQAGISFYSSSNCTAQNCIVLDGLFTCDGHYEYGFGIANGGLNTTYKGCISLNNDFYGSILEAEGIHLTNVSIENCVIWGCVGRGIIAGEHVGDTIWISNCTIGTLISDLEIGVGYSKTSSLNSIVYGCQQNALHQVVNSDYNCLYNNAQNYYGCNAGSHDMVDVNPLESSLLYLPRIEADSDLSGKGESGEDIGANVLTKIGRSGSLYGEEGWGEDTGENLWPFPNEDDMKELMKVYDLHGVNGKRGFCADSVGLYGGRITLTSYIWEYLGNPCPVDVCNYYDVNRDRHVNVQDVQIVVNHILGRSTSENADTTGDGSVNIQDVQGVVNVILAGRQA